MSILTTLAGWKGYALAIGISAILAATVTVIYLNSVHGEEIAKIHLDQANKDNKALNLTLTNINSNLDDMRTYALRSTQASEQAASNIVRLNEELKDAPTALPVGCRPDAFRVRNLYDQIAAANGESAAAGFRLGPTLPQDSVPIGK